MFEDKFYNVNNVLIRTEIADIPFCCDLKKCKGACCTFESDYGAPLKEDEVGVINESLAVIMEYLSDEHKEEINKRGFFERKDGELLTRSIDNKACVFVTFEDGIAKCAIEKAFNDGKTKFKKPISCHLFPIRVSDFGGDVLKYERLNECNPALEKGKKENLTIAEFCKEPLSRLYGEKWYSNFLKEIGR